MSEHSETVDEFAERMRIEVGLATSLTEHVRELPGTMAIGSARFYPVHHEDVPGYGDRDDTLLLRSESDNRVFEIAIDVTATLVPLPEASA